MVPGEVTEWPKVYDWKSYARQKRAEGSNPSLSAVPPDDWVLYDGRARRLKPVNPARAGRQQR